MRKYASAVAVGTLAVAGIAMSVPVSPAQATPRNAVLFSFAGPDGAFPSDVTADAAGVLYGTTFNGGSSTNCYRNCGTIFRLVPPAQDGQPWVHQVLYSFQGLTDGADPVSRPILDGNGNLYGVAPGGGNAPCGTSKNGCAGAGVVWELSPPAVQGGAWTYQVLHTFTGHDFVRSGGEGGPNVDGFHPIGPPVRDSAGALYGTTTAGGAAPHYVGLIYELSPPAQAGQGWTETILHDFRGADADGGTELLLTGGQKLLLSLSGVYSPHHIHNGDDVLYDFHLDSTSSTLGIRGYFDYWTYGWGTPILDQHHNMFYQAGQIGYGQQSGGGVVELSPPAAGSGPWTANVIYRFPDGSGLGYYLNRTGPLLPLSTGTLFGSTGSSEDGAGAVDGSHGPSGAIFRLDPPSGSSTTWTYTELHEFDGSTGADGGRPDGDDPEGALTFGRDHQIFGTTLVGGRYGEGTVFMQTWH